MSGFECRVDLWPLVRSQMGVAEGPWCAWQAQGTKRRLQVVEGVYVAVSSSAPVSCVRASVKVLANGQSSLFHGAGGLDQAWVRVLPGGKKMVQLDEQVQMQMQTPMPHHYSIRLTSGSGRGNPFCVPSGTNVGT